MAAPKTVYKYVIPLEDFPTIQAPPHLEWLHVAEQGGKLCIWARVDPNRPLVKHKLRVAGTGHPEVEGFYLGSALMREGALVFHVFHLGLEEP